MEITETRRVLFDDRRSDEERLRAGQALAATATGQVGNAAPTRGAIPPDLPPELHEVWQITHDDREPVQRRLLAVEYLVGSLDGRNLAKAPL